MATKISVAVRNAWLDAIETAIGVSAVLKLRTGAPPANITDADSGTVVATMNLVTADDLVAQLFGEVAVAGEAAVSLGNVSISATGDTGEQEHTASTAFRMGRRFGFGMWR
jgi:hypothetical protein